MIKSLIKRYTACPVFGVFGACPVFGVLGACPVFGASVVLAVFLLAAPAPPAPFLEYLGLPESAAISQDTNTLFNEGNYLYQNGQYESALEKYTAILESGFESGELYYNIANAFYKLNNMGKAVLNFERARRLMPEDDDLLNNIDLVTISLADRIIPIDDVFYVRYWNTFRRMLGLSAWKAVFFSAWLFTALNCILLLFIPQRRAKKIAKVGLAAGCIVVVIVAMVFLSYNAMDKPGLDGVVMVQETNVYSSPSETGTELFLIHEGTKVHIKRTIDDWIEIRLADGKVGWIEKSDIEII